MNKYYKNNSEYTLQEIKRDNANTSFNDPAQLGYEIIHASQEPEVGELEIVIEDGSDVVEGKRVRLWKVVDMFTDTETKTKEEQEAKYLKDKNIVNVPDSITMRQARLILLQNNLLQTVTEAIQNSSDESMKIEWEYATEIDRHWSSLIILSMELGVTSDELDRLFIEGAKL